MENNCIFIATLTNGLSQRRGRLSFLLLFAILLMVASSCNRSGNTSSSDSIPWEENMSGRFVIDDGIVVTDSIGQGPLNEKITVLAKDGRHLGMAGRTSEMTGLVVVRFIYCDNGRLVDCVETAFIDMNDSEIDDYENEYGRIRNLFVDWAAGKRELEENVNIFRFRRDGENIVEVYDDKGTNSIKAGSGQHIEYEVAECDSFWASDMFGGDFVVLLHLVPDDTNVDVYSIDTYSEYKLQMRSTYRNGTFCERTVYKSESDSVYDICRVTEKDGKHIYSFKNNPVIYTYENGVLKTVDYLSKYGTVIGQEVYFLSADKQAYIKYWKEYDYSRKTLVKQSEERIDIKDFLEEHPERYVRQMGSQLFDSWNGHFCTESPILNR